MHAEIIAIGDEITSGQTLDTNSQWLSQRLEELGIRTLFHTTVGDELDPCADAFRHAMGRADIIIVTGGLGPTADDLTRQALAQATGHPLQLNQQALEHIRAIFARLGRQMPPQNEIQAMFPAGSRVVPNPHGTAPGIDMEVPRTETEIVVGETIAMSNTPSRQPPASPSIFPCRVFCLPGVPAEMIEMWRQSIAPAVLSILGSGRRVVLRRTIHCFGAGESQIESMLPDMIRRGRQPTVGITASKATISLRIAAEGATKTECLAAIEPAAAMIRQCLGTLVYGEDNDQLQDAVVRLLRSDGKTLATTDDATAGLLSQWLASAEGSGDVYRGGLVLKSAATPADTLAVQCREQFGADYGLAISHASDIAKNNLPSPASGVENTLRSPACSAKNSLPSPASGRGAGGEGSQPSSVTIALASAAGVQSKTLAFGLHPELREIYLAKQALNLLRLLLLRA